VFNYSYDAGNNLLEVVDSIDGVIKRKKVFNYLPQQSWGSSL
jgi:hypothetical protein